MGKIMSPLRVCVCVNKMAYSLFTACTQRIIIYNHMFIWHHKFV